MAGDDTSRHDFGAEVPSPIGAREENAMLSHDAGKHNTESPSMLRKVGCRPGRAAMAWLRSLPEDLQPVQLMRGYARIANLLCHRWDDPELALRYLRELLVDVRGGRHGFPGAVASELHALAEYLTWLLRTRQH